MRASRMLHANRLEFIQIFSRYPMFSHLRIVGSIESGTDTEDSDIDIYVDATDEATLFDIGNLNEELENLLDMPVDIFTSQSRLAKQRMENFLSGKEEF